MKIASLKKGYAALNTSDWVGSIPFPLFEGISFKVRRPWNGDWMAMRAELIEKATATMAPGQALSDESDAEIDNQCMVRCCLDDWKGIDDEYKPELALDIMADPELGRPFRNAVLWAADQRKAIVAAQIEADEKN